MKEVLFSYGYLKDGYIYYLSDNWPLYAKYNIETNTIEPNILKQEIAKKRIYIEKYISFDKGVIGLARNGKYLIRIGKKIDDISIYEMDAGTEEWGNYAAASVYNDKLYIFTKKQNKLIIFNLNTNTFSEKKLKDIFNIGVNINANMWLLSARGERLIRYDMNTNEVHTVCLNETPKDIVYINRVEKNIYLLSRTGDIWTFDTEKNNLSSIYEAIDYHDVCRLVITDNKFIELPALGKDIYIINKDDMSCSIYDEYPKDFNYIGPNGWSRYSDCYNYEDLLVFSRRSTNYILMIDLKTSKIIWRKPIEPSITDVYEYSRCVDNKVIEGQLSLKEFIGLCNSF